MSLIRFNAARVSRPNDAPIISANVQAMNDYIESHDAIKDGQLFFNVEEPSVYWWSKDLNQAVRIDCDLSNYVKEEDLNKHISKYLNEDSDHIRNKQIHNTNSLAEDALKTSLNNSINFDSTGGSVALINNSVLKYGEYLYTFPQITDTILTWNSAATLQNKVYRFPVIDGDFIHSEVVQEANPEFQSDIDPELRDPKIPEYIEVEKQFNNQLPAGDGRLALESHIPNIAGLATKDALQSVKDALDSAKTAFDQFKEIAATASDVANVLNTARQTFETIKNVKNMKDAILSQAKSAALAAIAGAGSSLLMDALTDTVFTGTPQNIYRKYIWIHDKEVFDDSWTTFASSDETFKIRWEYQDKFKVPFLGDLPIIGNLFDWKFETRAGYYEFPAHGKGGTTKIAGENWVYGMLSNYAPLSTVNEINTALSNCISKTEANTKHAELTERLDRLEGIVSLALDYLEANGASGIKSYISTHSPQSASSNPLNIGAEYTTETKFNKLITYLENWMNCGNINMSDIRTFI